MTYLDHLRSLDSQLEKKSTQMCFTFFQLLAFSICVPRLVIFHQTLHLKSLAGVQVEHLISGMLHTKLVSYLQKQDLHSFRLVLNLEHIYRRRSEPGQHFWPRDDAELPRGPSLGDFMKENGFRRLAPVNSWDP